MLELRTIEVATLYILDQLNKKYTKRGVNSTIQFLKTAIKRNIW